MSYNVAVPLAGYAGWAVLNRTIESQQDALNESAEIKRNTEYFEANIGNITSAEELMADRRLLTVALDAFGLGEDINSTYLIQKILSDGTEADDALANKLGDASYVSLSEAFGFGNTDGPDLTSSAFASDIIERYQNTKFVESVGESSEAIELALITQSAMPDITAKDTTDNGLWYTILGNESVRAVFETALGLPEEIGSIDIDQQVTEFREKSKRYFGNGEVSQFSEPEKLDELIRLFLARSEINELGSGSTAAENALTLISGG
jgi:hypothetical protein